MTSKILLLLISAGLFGCANQTSKGNDQYVSRADEIWNSNNAKIKSSNESAKNCYLSKMNTPEAKIVYGQILIENQNASNRYDLLASKAKLNGAQKSALKKYLSEQSFCRQQRLSDLKGFPHANTYQISYTQNDQVYAGLLNGSLTIGKANEQLEAIRAQRRASLSKDDAYHRKLYEEARQREYENGIAAIQLGWAMSGANPANRTTINCTSTSYGRGTIDTQCY